MSNGDLCVKYQTILDDYASKYLSESKKRSAEESSMTRIYSIEEYRRACNSIRCESRNVCYIMKSMYGREIEQYTPLQKASISARKKDYESERKFIRDHLQLQFDACGKRELQFGQILFNNQRDCDGYIRFFIGNDSIEFQVPNNTILSTVIHPNCKVRILVKRK
jgi:hypothetical protein